MNFLFALLMLVTFTERQVAAAVHFQTLRFFGNADQLSYRPTGGLVRGSDGALYGATEEIADGDGRVYVPATVFKVGTDGSGYCVLHRFPLPDVNGGPYAWLIEGSDGALYGTTVRGGNTGSPPFWGWFYGFGTVFKLNKDGSGYAVLHSFGLDDGGRAPQAAPLEGSDGVLYGTTSSGPNNSGTVFKLNKDGSGYGILHSFGDGQSSVVTLAEGMDEALYGTTSGTFGNGAVFKLQKDGSAYSVLYSFGSTAADGRAPNSLVDGTDGVLYGTTIAGGGSGGGGTIFKIRKDGTGYGTLYSFRSVGRDAEWPQGLVEGANGALYGTASGGLYGLGAIFKVNKDGTGYSVWYNLDGPPTGLVPDSNGEWYGTMSWSPNSGGSVFKINKDASSFNFLHQFSESGGDAQNPTAPLLEGNDEALYGTTSRGGAAGGGTVFTCKKDGTGYSILRSFVSDQSDGFSPGALIEGSDGALYGTTSQGGGSDEGTVFRLKKDGSGYGTLHKFAVTDGDGRHPSSPLLEASDGVLYGTTSSGGKYPSRITPSGAGTMFKLNKDGSGYEILHQFGENSGDGQNPLGALIEGNDGLLYGTTSGGGAHISQRAAAYGTVFKSNKDGSGYGILHSFGMNDGHDGWPRGLLEASDGTFYGIGSSGGCWEDTGECGRIFKLNKDGTDGTGYTVLHVFGGIGDGAGPIDPLFEGSDGRLYGTTAGGIRTSRDSVYGAGTLFRLNKDGSGYSILYTFDQSSSPLGPNATGPLAGVIKGADGAFYGTTHSGGDLGLGTVFRFLHSDSPNALGLLDIAVNGETSTISWSSLSTGFVLESRANLESAGWQVETKMPTQKKGRWEVTVTSDSAQRFFRLHRP